MYKPNAVEKKMQAIAMLAETTKSYQQVMHECGLSWDTIVELKNEMIKMGISFEHRNGKYTPTEQRTDLGKPTELNVNRWHNEVSAQSRRRGPAVHIAKSRTRAMQNTEALIAKYKPSSSG